MNELERLHRANLVILRQAETIADLKAQCHMLATELRIANLRQERKLARMAAYPALLRPQA